MSDSRPRGAEVTGWTPPPAPPTMQMDGAHVRLEPLDAGAHAAMLFQAFDGHDAVWDYMPAGPFASAAQFHRWVQGITSSPDFVFFAIFDKSREAYGGFASYLRVQPDAGSIEVGYIAMAPKLQRTIAATEAMYLMMKWAFDAGYRRYEWKCDALNIPSRRAAQRLGLSYEGIFRQATVVKGRNRDTAWFAAIDTDWPALNEAFRLWLDPANFDAERRQKSSLSDLTRLVRVSGDPALNPR